MPSDIIRRSSSVLRTTKAKDTLRAVVKVVGKAEYMGAYGVETLAIHQILRDGLPSYVDLGPYRRVRQVHASRRFAVDPDVRPAYVDACALLGSAQTRMYVRSRGVERDSEGEPDLTLMTGWGILGQAGSPLKIATAAPMCRFEINEESPGYLDKAYRRDLFARAAEAMGCPDALKLDLVDGTLTVWAAEGWRALPIRGDLAGRNPSGIALFGFADIRVAMEAGERVLGRLFRRVYENSLISATSEEDVYESLRAPLNNLAEGWEVTVSGNLTESAAAVLAGRIPEGGTTPGRVPAIVWLRERLQTDLLVGEFVAVDGGYALELASQTLPPERLDACVKAVEALPAVKAKGVAGGRTKAKPRADAAKPQEGDRTGLEAADVIDMITKDGDGRLNMVVVDSGMIEDEHERLLLLGRKLGSYVQYCLDDAFAERHPGVSIEAVRFLVVCATPPTPGMRCIEGIATRGPGSAVIPVAFQS